MTGGMSIFDSPVTKTLLALDKADDSDAVFGSTGARDALHTTAGGIHLLQGPHDALDSGGKSYQAFRRGDYLEGTAQGAGAVSAAAGTAKTLGADSRTLGAVGSGASAVKSGINSYRAFADGDYVGGSSSAMKAVSSGMKTAQALGSTAKWLGPAGSALDTVATGINAYQQFDRGRYMEGTSSAASALSKAAATARLLGATNPALAPVGAAAAGLGMGIDVGNRANAFAAEHNLFGKDTDGKSRTMSDAIGDSGADVHDSVSDFLGGGTVGDVAGHIAGGATVLAESAAGTVAAVPMAVIDAFSGPTFIDEMMAREKQKRAFAARMAKARAAHEHVLSVARAEHIRQQVLDAGVGGLQSVASEEDPAAACFEGMY